MTPAPTRGMPIKRKPTPAQNWICRTCERQWTGTTQAHCTTCHEQFSTASSFDAHWRGKGDDRQCVDPATLLDAKGLNLLVKAETAYGPVWRRREVASNLKPWQKADV